MPDKFLVIQTAFIGDAILTLPMIEKLKEKFPSEEIDVLCIPSTQEIFSASPFVSGVLVLDKRGKHKSILQMYKFANQIKDKKYSKIFSPHRSFRTSLLVTQSGVKDTYGFSTSSMFHVYKHVVDYEFESHEVQRNLKLIGFDYSSDSWRIIPKLTISELARSKVLDFLSYLKPKRDFIAIAPGSIWKTKRYPEKYFREIINYFINRSYNIIVIGSEADKEMCERIAGSNGSSLVSAAGKFSIIESIELLRNVKLLVTNDSAPTHMGVCADIPVLTIYTSTIPGFGFYPYNKKSSYISYDNLKCKPCGIHGYEFCPIKTFDCGEKLVPQNIITKMEDILSDQN
jgi:heptosyltransferase-2